MEKTMTKNIVCKFLAFSIALLPTSLFAWEIYEESRVDGTTDTITTGTIIRTTQGRVYEVISGYEYEYEYRLDILVLRSGERYRLRIENFDDEFTAICYNCSGSANNSPSPDRSKPCYTSFIQAPAPFLGNGGETIVLGDGSIWTEESYQYLYLYEYYPNVLVCPSSGKMLLGRNEFTVVPSGN